MYTAFMQTLQQFLLDTPKKHLIFDFDETIFTLDLPWHVYYEEMSKRLHQLDSTLPETKSINDLENMAVKKLGNVAQQVRWQYSQEFEAGQLKGVKELTDLTNFIKENTATYRFYLWTSNMRSTVEPILTQYNMLSLFTRLATKGDVKFTKPYPDGFLLLNENGEDDKKDWLMIGNSYNDRGAAEQSGIDYWMRPQ